MSNEMLTREEVELWIAEGSLAGLNRKENRVLAAYLVLLDERDRLRDRASKFESFVDTLEVELAAQRARNEKLEAQIDSMIGMTPERKKAASTDSGLSIDEVLHTGETPAEDGGIDS